MKIGKKKIKKGALSRCIGGCLDGKLMPALSERLYAPVPPNYPPNEANQKSAADSLHNGKEEYELFSFSLPDGDERIGIYIAEGITPRQAIMMLLSAYGES